MTSKTVKIPAIILIARHNRDHQICDVIAQLVLRSGLIPGPPRGGKDISDKFIEIVSIIIQI